MKYKKNKDSFIDPIEEVSESDSEEDLRFTELVERMNKKMGWNQDTYSQSFNEDSCDTHSDLTFYNPPKTSEPQIMMSSSNDMDTSKEEQSYKVSIAQIINTEISSLDCVLKLT